MAYKRAILRMRGGEAEKTEKIAGLKNCKMWAFKSFALGERIGMRLDP